MKHQIEPKDILKGDLVRYEYRNTPGRAEEWIAERDTHTDNEFGMGNHFLRERKTPAPKNGEVWRSPRMRCLTYTWDALDIKWLVSTGGSTDEHPSTFGMEKVAEGVA